MATMLPAGFPAVRSLADVLPSCLAAILGDTASNTLSLSSVERVVVVVVDGLGAHALRSRPGHARFLAPRLTKATTLSSGSPTTTVAALTTLTTGRPPGEHGMVGYTVLDPERETVFNQLSGWGRSPDPTSWQRCQTVFERAREHGVASFAIASERYRSSSFTRASLRGAEYVGAASMADRFTAAEDVLGRGGRSISYLYVPELDTIAHAKGWESDAWIAALEELDGCVSAFAGRLGPRDGVILTADHGVLDVPEHAHVLFDSVPELIDGVAHVGGDPRLVQLYVDADADPTAVDGLAAAWTRSEGSRAWVATRSEAIAAGWFGPRVADQVRTRIGDVLIAARRRVAYYDGRTASASGLRMIGQHGSFSAEEVAVPLIGIGGFDA